MLGGVNRKRDRDLRSKKSKSASSTSAAVLESNGSEINFPKKSMEDMAAGFSSILFALGETNDEEETAEDMAEDIFAAFKDAEEKQKKKKHKR